jgi:uracil-DNA glycosylase family protein
MSEVERPGAQQWVPRRPSLRNLREAVEGCRGCELHRDANHGVMGEGSLRAEVMVIGEQPGDREDLEGRPFVGPAGKLLDQALGEAGIDPGRVFRTNVVKHFRHEGTRGKQRIHKSPSRWHVAACGPWLVAEVALVRPRGVVILGATAGKALYGNDFRVGEARGLLRPWPGVPGARTSSHVPEWVLATTHPAAVLRSRQRADDLAALVGDLRVAALALREPEELEGLERREVM